MPLDASDRIRKIQEITLFTGYAINKQTTQPGVNVSSCATFYTSTINQFPSYTLAYQTIEGRGYFSTCQTGQ